MRDYPVFDCDVLVIGGGIAGGKAAIEAADSGAEVILVDKSLFGKSGASGIHPSWWLASSIRRVEGDNPSIHFEDTMRAGDNINNSKLVRILTNEAMGEILELERYGNIFTRNEDGQIRASREGGHSHARSFSPAFMWIMANMVRRRGVRIFEENAVTSLLTHGGTVVGATSLDIRTGAFQVFRAKSVVLATGGAGQVHGRGSVMAHTTNPIESTGDGYLFAYEAGAELRDMEFVQFLLGVMYPPQFKGFMSGAAYMKDSIYDKDGEAWCKTIPMTEFTRARMVKELLTRIRQGKGSPHGGIWLDFSKEVDKLPSLSRDRGIYILPICWSRMGFNVKKERIEVYPTCHHFMGGVSINEKSESTIPGLYACGEVAGGVHGSNRLGTNAFTDCLVFGRRAGKHAAERAETVELQEIDWDQIEQERQRVYDVLESNPSEPIRTHEIRRKVQMLMWEKASVMKEGRDLREALRELEEIRTQELPRMYVASKSKIYNIEWIEALEMRSLFCTGEAVLRASLMRTESRGSHQRLDYPNIDDENWLANITISKSDGKMRLDKRLTKERK